jgi:hypothetical protein
MLSMKRLIYDLKTDEGKAKGETFISMYYVWLNESVRSRCTAGIVEDLEAISNFCEEQANS